MASEKISVEQVRHVALLARLELSAEDEAKLQTDMSNILDYVDKLGELDTSSIEPTAQVGEAGTPMRDDAITNYPDPEGMLANAPKRRGGFFEVPKIIE